MKRSGFKRKVYDPNNPPTVKPRKPLARVSKKKVKKPTVTSIRKKLDAVFSRYVRQKYADSEGMVTCFTCPWRGHWKQIQNGHLVSRYYLATRFDERNCRPQCYVCNMIRNGMTPHFAEKLDLELGKGTVDTLYKQAREISIDFPYAGLIEKYTNLLKENATTTDIS